jgi:hypothetical protein
MVRIIMKNAYALLRISLGINFAGHDLSNRRSFDYAVRR